MEDNNLDKFKFVKRRLSVHYSISREMASDKDSLLSTPNRSPSKNNKSIKRRTILMQEKSIKKLKDIYLKNNSGLFFHNEERLSDYIEKLLDYSSVEEYLLGNYNPDFLKILHILITPFNERTKKDSENLLAFFNKIKLNETLKSDTLITDLSMNELFEYFKPYISGKVFNFMDTIYNRREKSNNLYIILHGSIGQYRLEKYEEELTCEDYFNFLADCYTLYEEEMQMGYFYTEKDEPKKSYKITTKSITDFLNNNINIKEHKEKLEEKKEKNESEENKTEENNYESDDDSKDDDNTEQYIDHYLICQMIEENKEKYPLRDISDLVRLKKIIFKLRLYVVLTESSVKEAEILYLLYEFPTTYLNFDKVLNKVITVQKYIEILANNFKLYDYFYLKLLGTEKNKVKLMKYVKTSKNLGPFSAFGNYELNDLRAKRDLTVRCESDKCILLSIDKRMYSLAVYNAQKKKRDQDIEIMHNCFLFKNLSRKYFNNRVFSVFRIKNAFKGNVLIKQFENLNNFIFIKEGVLELSLQNSSFNEFHQIIKEAKEILIRKAKELKMNQKDLLDFESEVDCKTNLHMNTIKGLLNQKQTFLFHRNENGAFGEYEFYFQIPSILTATVVSDKCLYYQYNTEKYQQLIQETYLLNESLKTNSLLKLKSLLKRMIMVYNSYWRLSIEQLEKKLKEKEDLFYNENGVEENKTTKKGFSLTKAITNIPLSNLNITNRNSYKNMNIFKRESVFNKNNNIKGIENTSTNINFNLNILRRFNMNEQNPINIKTRLSTMIDKNQMKLDNRNPISLYKQNKNIPNRTFILKNIKRKNDSSFENNKITFTENNEINNYKSINLINRDDYKKKLIEKFKHEMESQRVAKKKTTPKIFLPPLTCLSPGKLKFQLNFNTENNRNLKTKKSINLENKNTQNSNKNFINDNSNVSILINNSYSGNSSKINMDNDESLNSNNESKIKSNINKKRGISKILYKRSHNLKLAQLYNIISRKEKEKKK